MSSNKSNRVNMAIPIGLEEMAREKAYKLGIIQAGRGALSPYIKKLVCDDIRMKPDYSDIDPIVIEDITQKRINITLEEEIKEQAMKRAEYLGFIYDNKGNLSAYIRYLLLVSVSKDQ